MDTLGVTRSEFAAAKQPCPVFLAGRVTSLHGLLPVPLDPMQHYVHHHRCGFTGSSYSDRPKLLYKFAAFQLVAKEFVVLLKK